jgi:4-hydroxy-2-oxoheptanedioate aldolase
MEHGAGDYDALVLQLIAVEGTGAGSVVRIAWNEAPRFKRVLDLGASGVMVPYVNNAEEASAAVAAMRYPPQGIRGVSRSNRAAAYGKNFDRYFEQANRDLLTVLQIETVEAVGNAAEIAAVDGADVLFVGPLDLSTNMGIRSQFNHEDFIEAIASVAKACREQGKAAGILLPGIDTLDRMIDLGFTFFVAGSEGGILSSGMDSILSFCSKRK